MHREADLVFDAARHMPADLRRFISKWVASDSKNDRFQKPSPWIFQ